MKKILPVLFCLVLLACTFAGCGKEEDTPKTKIYPNVVIADLIGINNEELQKRIGTTCDVETVDNRQGLDFYDEQIFVSFNLDFDSSENIPSSFYVNKVVCGTKPYEIIYGVKPGMSYYSIKEIKQLSGISELNEPASDADGVKYSSVTATATVKYNDRNLFLTFSFDGETKALIRCSIEIEEEMENNSTAYTTATEVSATNK